MSDNVRTATDGELTSTANNQASAASVYESDLMVTSNLAFWAVQVSGIGHGLRLHILESGATIRPLFPHLHPSTSDVTCRVAVLPGQLWTSISGGRPCLTRASEPELWRYLNFVTEIPSGAAPTFSHAPTATTENGPQLFPTFPQFSHRPMWTPIDPVGDFRLKRDASRRSPTLVDDCLRVPKVEVAGSSPVPRSTKNEFKFRTRVLGKSECGKQLRSSSDTFSHKFN